MAVIRPFQGYRPLAKFAEEVAALPYDVMTAEEARKMVKGKPYSFLHVDRAEIDLPADMNPYDEAVYQKARQNLKQMIEKGIYMQDDKPCYYLYRQIFQGRMQTGLVACASIDDYLNHAIKKHELTRRDKEEDRVRHVDTCNAHTGPIFLAYRHHEDIRRLLNIWTEKPPVYQFTSSGGVKNEIWVIDDDSVAALLTMQFSEVESFYIADGHHRAASAVRVAQQRRLLHPDYTGDEEFNYFLAVLFPEDELHIMAYNRLVKDLNGLDSETFLKKTEESFQVQKYGDGSPLPERHQFGMRLDGCWYLLTARPEKIDESNPVGRLDVSILQNELLQPVLGIDDPRTNKRIEFVGGIRGTEELERRTDEDMKLAFLLHEVGMDDLMSIADADLIMPPKSTWFEPKLLSGLILHGMEDEK